MSQPRVERGPQSETRVNFFRHPLAAIHEYEFQRELSALLVDAKYGRMAFLNLSLTDKAFSNEGNFGRGFATIQTVETLARVLSDNKLQDALWNKENEAHPQRHEKEAVIENMRRRGIRWAEGIARTHSFLARFFARETRPDVALTDIIQLLQQKYGERLHLTDDILSTIRREEGFPPTYAVDVPPTTVTLLMRLLPDPRQKKWKPSLTMRRGEFIFGVHINDPEHAFALRADERLLSSILNHYQLTNFIVDHDHNAAKPHVKRELTLHYFTQKEFVTAFARRSGRDYVVMPAKPMRKGEHSMTFKRTDGVNIHSLTFTGKDSDPHTLWLQIAPTLSLQDGRQKQMREQVAGRIPALLRQVLTAATDKRPFEYRGPDPYSTLRKLSLKRRCPDGEIRSFPTDMVQEAAREVMHAPEELLKAAHDYAEGEHLDTGKHYRSKLTLPGSNVPISVVWRLDPGYAKSRSPSVRIVCWAEKPTRPLPPAGELFVRGGAKK